MERRRRRFPPKKTCKVENTLENIYIRALSMIDTLAGKQLEEEEEKPVTQTYHGDACRYKTYSRNNLEGHHVLLYDFHKPPAQKEYHSVGPLLVMMTQSNDPTITYY